MADPRYSNPAYTLDVDVMILDYLLYNTTKGHLDDFRSDSTSSRSAASLIQVFDTFLCLFKHNHPEHRWPGGRDFSLKLLEFAVLFTGRKDPKSVPSFTMSQLKEAYQGSIPVRMHWWAHRPNHSFSSYVEENRIYDSWRSDHWHDRTSEYAKQLQLRASSKILFAELLPHFLDLSASISLTIGQKVTEQWMHLAAEFMLQSAWEKHAYLDLLPGEESLEVAFAWGWQPQRCQMSGEGISKEDMALEDRLNEMFEVGEEGEDGAVVVDESPAWARIRSSYLAMFDLPGRDETMNLQLTPKPQLQRLKDIAAQFPMDAFEAKVVDFLEGLWKLERKPLLAQVEEGMVDGLSPEEFEEFQGNVWPAGSGS